MAGDLSAWIGEMAGASSRDGLCSGHARHAFVGDVPTPPRGFEPRRDAWQAYANALAATEFRNGDRHSPTAAICRPGLPFARGPWRPWKRTHAGPRSFEAEAASSP
jgi:hypothetical protein